MSEKKSLKRETPSGSKSISNTGKSVERIVISCITFDTVKITDPIIHYDATKAYLVHYCDKGSDDKKTFYNELYDTVLEILDEHYDTNSLEFNVEECRYEESPIKNDTVFIDNVSKKLVKELTVVDVNEVVYDFNVMLKTMFSIMNFERRFDEDSKNPIYVNISAGSSEFSAAALMASMMFDNVEVFSVHTEEHMIDDVKKYYDENERFVGLAKSVREPIPITNFTIPRPDKRLILSLKVYFDLGCPSATETIRALKDHSYMENGEKIKLWGWDEKELPNEKMIFQRQFIDRWVSEGLVDRVSRGTYELTNHGRFTIDTYYVNECVSADKDGL
jgi:hypothetical protein